MQNAANDMLWGSDRPNDGLDFLLQLNLFVKTHVIDVAELCSLQIFIDKCT